MTESSYERGDKPKDISGSSKPKGDDSLRNAFINARVIPKSGDTRLAMALVTATAENAASIPALPPGCRKEVIDLLTRLMVAAPVPFDSYLTSLEQQLERHEIRTMVQNRNGLDISEESVLRNGFANLSDSQLADIAVSPKAIEKLRYIHDEAEEELGDWYFDALIEADKARTAPEEHRRQVDVALRALKDAGLFPSESATHEGE